MPRRCPEAEAGTAAGAATSATAAAPPCFKCKAAPGFTPSRDGPKRPLCVGCFVEYVERLAKDTFYRFSRVPSETSVALCVSGGTNSMTLLHLIGKWVAENLRRGGQGTIRYKITVVHLNELGLVEPATSVDGQRRHAAAEACVRREAERLGLPFFAAPMTILGPLGAGSGGVEETTSAAARVAEIAVALQGPLPLSDREDLYHAVRRQALCRLAVAAGCPHGLILAENATVSACRMLGNVVRGRGNNAGVECAFRSTVPGPSLEVPAMTVYRPLRAVLGKEMALFARAQSVPTVFVPTLGTLSSLRSIDRSVETFVLTLAGPFRSTVFNINNTVLGLECDAPALSGGAAESAPNEASKRDDDAPPLGLSHSVAAAAAAAIATGCPVCRLWLDPERDSGSSIEEGDEPRAAAFGEKMCYGCREVLRRAKVNAVAPFYHQQ